jgi:glycosyltransferase involved in cell wall biosynthesis
MSKQLPLWICCQLGAREHYAIPRALHQTGQLANLITDAWVRPKSVLNRLPKLSLAQLRERFHVDLAQASVHSFNSSLIGFELAQRIAKTSGWERIIARNNWFQKQAVQFLDATTLQINSRPTLFAYSYAALELFRHAKRKGWRTILGQIDPGLFEEKLLLAEHRTHPNYQSTWQAAPSQYWDMWQEECSLADRIVVNSLWSSQALQKVGIPDHKIDIVPLAYEPPQKTDHFVRTYPSTFSAERPLRVLFLGQVILRKGIAAVLEAAELLRHQPIEFWLVGSQGISKPQQSHPQVKWISAVPRSATAKYYEWADIFLFPTLSDGFGLTQLEAQAWKLPIIASRFCGNVVKDQVNGLLLNEVTGEAITELLKFCLQNPRKLEALAKQSTDTYHFSLLQLGHYLQSLPNINQ